MTAATPPTLPCLPGLTWSRHKMPGFKTRVAASSSGREVRAPLMANPLYEFDAVYSGLSSSTTLYAGLGGQSQQTLMAFFADMLGQYGTFLYSDPTDHIATFQPIGIGDGVTKTFTLTRTLPGGSLAEPVGWVLSLDKVYFGGVGYGVAALADAAGNALTDGSGNTLTVNQVDAYAYLVPPNQITFLVAPPASLSLAVDISFAYVCRFLDDQMDFEEFMSSLWKLDSMKFRSLKS
jgi:hypothetical protein